MGLLQSLTSLFQTRNVLNNPAVSLSSPGIWAWLDNGEPTSSGEVINDQTAMQQATVYSCIRCLSESVASLPLKLYSRSGNGRQEAIDHPLYRLLAIEPNLEMTALTFFESFVGSLALTGNGYAEIQRNVAGDPISLWPLHPRLTEPIRLPSGDLAYRTSDGMDTGTRIIVARNVLHCPLFCFDGLRGLSPIQQARQTIGLARATEKYGAKFFGNGSRPGGILSTSAELDDKQQALVRETWAASQGGQNSHKTATLWGDWKYQAIGLSPEESQFLETRKFQRAEIAALFRVPPNYIGDLTRLSNSNHEQQSLDFVTNSLRPYLARIEAEVIRKLFPADPMASRGYTVSFDVSERLRGDFATTMAGYAIGKTNGWISSNDIRRELGENPIGPEGDVYTVQVTMQDSRRLLTTESIQDQPVGDATSEQKGNPE